MTDSADTAAEKYPHTTADERRIVQAWGHWLNNTGGNDPLDLINDLRNPKNERMAFTNVVRFTLAVAVQSQVHLIATLEKHGVQL